jgi:hypothetical protein
MVPKEIRSAKGDPMSNLIATSPTRAPAFRDQPGADQADLGRERPSRLWAVLEALAYAGAFIDPSGILAVQRLRQTQEEERNGHR